VHGILLKDITLCNLFIRVLGTLLMLLFVILPFVSGPLSFECTVDRQFMFNQKLTGLFILRLGVPSILIKDILHFDWSPLSFDHTQSYFMLHHFSCGSYL